MTIVLLAAGYLFCAASLYLICYLLFYPNHRNVRWLWDWHVTVGVALHRNLVPEFIWVWEQHAQPPWGRK